MLDPLTKVRGFLLDLDGTFFLGEHLIEGALTFIETLHSQGKSFLFLSNNSSHHPRVYAKKISRLGLPVETEKIFTSADATALYLLQQTASTPALDLPRLYVVGTSDLEEQFRDYGFSLTDKDPNIVVLGYDTTLTYAKLCTLCNFVRAGLPYIATHPDINCPTETGFIPDIGAMIALVETSTGRKPDVILGKPNPLIATMAALRLKLPLSGLAMVGDRLYTDIALGHAAGIPSILVLSGETRSQDLFSAKISPTHTFAHLGALAKYLQAYSSL